MRHPLSLLIAACVGLAACATAQTTPPQNPSGLGAGFKNDRQDIRQDRTEEEALKQQIQQDKDKLEADRRAHAPKSQIEADRMQLHHDQQRLKSLKADIRRDKRDLKQDIRQRRHHRR